MIRIDLIRQNTNHPDESYHYSDRAYCVTDTVRIETAGPAPIHRLARRLCRYGYGDAAFEVWDDQPLFGGPGRVILAGKVRHLLRLAPRKPANSNDGLFGVDLLSQIIEYLNRAPQCDEPSPPVVHEPPVVHLWIKRAIEALEALENE